MCVEDVSKVLICNSFPHFKVCILVHINLKTLFRVLLETTSFTCESEKGTPVFLPEKNILKKNSHSACENYKGRKSHASLSASPAEMCWHRELYKSSLKRQVANRLCPLAHGGVSPLGSCVPSRHVHMLAPQGLFLRVLMLTLAYPCCPTPC